MAERYSSDVSSSDEEEVEINEEDKLLIMERVARLRFGDLQHKEPNEKESPGLPEKDDIEYFFKTGELSKKDRLRMIDSAFEEFVKHGADKIKIKGKINKDDQEISNKDQMLFKDMIEKIKTQNMEDYKPRTISKKDEDAIKNILNTNTMVDYDYIHDMPTRPNSRCNYREKDLEKRDENNCVKSASEDNPQKTYKKNKKEMAAQTNKNSLKKSCETVVGNIRKRIDDSCTAIDLSNATKSLDDSDDFKERFLLGMDEVRAVDATSHKSLSKDTATTISLYKKKKIAYNISEEVEVVDITDEAEHCRERFMAQIYGRNKTSYNLNKCIIEEKSFNFSKFITPMNDPKSPFFIDKREVSVKTYQDGLNDHWNPTQVVYEICSQLQWSPPEFKQHDYSMSRGFHFGVSIQDYHFIPKERASNKKTAKHYASTFFLLFLGFKFSFNDSYEQSEGLSTDRHHRECTAIKYKDTRDCKSYYYLEEEKSKSHYSNRDKNMKPNYISNTEYTVRSECSKVYFPAAQQSRLGRTQNRNTFSGASVFSRVMTNFGFLSNKARGKKRSRSRSS